MEIFFREKSHSEILVREKIFRPPKLGSRSPPLLCFPKPGTRGRSSLRSLEQGLLFVPFARTSTNLHVHSGWLAPLCGMGFLWRNDCSPEFFLTHFTLWPQNSSF